MNELELLRAVVDTQEELDCYRWDDAFRQEPSWFVNKRIELVKKLQNLKEELEHIKHRTVAQPG